MITRSEPLSGDLLKLKKQMRQHAVDAGLDFFEVIFEVCDYDTINILAAQGGFPSRYPHWRFGMEYDQLSKSYSYGLSKIYEMIINTDPSYAYLLKGNHWVVQKMVMAHVYGHSDFFKNNYWFAKTDRKMMDVMANHSTKIRRYMERYGHNEVESLIDRVHSLENLLDVSFLFSRVERPSSQKKGEAGEDEEEFPAGQSKALESYLRSRGQKKKVARKAKEAPIFRDMKLPERDVLKFLMDHAPLHEWEADIVGILREEAYYFLPQRCTKIMNEGWASYWHSKIMTEKAIKANELIEFCDLHSGVTQMSKQSINPYKIGIELFRDIEHRWDTGRFGKDYNECQDLREKENWDTKAGLGRDKIFEVRCSHNDVTFIDEFFTKEFCERMQLFTYNYNNRSGRHEISSRDFEAIKQKLLNSLENFGQPLIDVVEANYHNRGELLLAHLHHGVDLDVSYAQATMKNIYALWKRPVNLSTVYDGKEQVFHFDGKDFSAS